jgi:hypothetical protein
MLRKPTAASAVLFCDPLNADFMAEAHAIPVAQAQAPLYGYPHKLAIIATATSELLRNANGG